MNINITNININSISNIGSLNIGKTIICKNKASFSAYQTQQITEPPSATDGTLRPIGAATLPPPVPPHFSGPNIDLSRSDKTNTETDEQDL
jgi:hypothetical protein